MSLIISSHRSISLICFTLDACPVFSFPPLLLSRLPHSGMLCPARGGAGNSPELRGAPPGGERRASPGAARPPAPPQAAVSRHSPWAASTALQDYNSRRAPRPRGLHLPAGTGNSPRGVERAPGPSRERARRARAGRGALGAALGPATATASRWVSVGPGLGSGATPAGSAPVPAPLAPPRAGGPFLPSPSPRQYARAGAAAGPGLPSGPAHLASPVACLFASRGGLGVAGGFCEGAPPCRPERFGSPASPAGPCGWWDSAAEAACCCSAPASPDSRPDVLNQSGSETLLKCIAQRHGLAKTPLNCNSYLSCKKKFSPVIWKYSECSWFAFRLLSHCSIRFWLA